MYRIRPVGPKLYYNTTMAKIKHYKSALSFILIACIPYSEPGFMLAYKPNIFFNELEKISKQPK